MDDAVDRQERAYNAHDADAFAACYSEAAVLEDADAGVLMRGRDDVRQRYGDLFAGSPDVHAEIVSRMRVGRYVVCEERVTGWPRGDLHVVAVYHLDDDGLIDHVRFLR